MDLIKQDDLRELAGMNAEACVSIYMPTVKVEAQLAQNEIRLKNLIKKARTELDRMGIEGFVTQGILQPAQDLLDQEQFWLNMTDGLAIFLAPGFSRIYRLPATFEELVVTGHRFHMKPLFPLVQGNDRYYVLALSKNLVRLFRGSKHAFEEIESTHIPKNMNEALKYDDNESSHTMRTGGRREMRANSQAMFHGHGQDARDQNSEYHDELRRYFEEVDDGLMSEIGFDNAPLILASIARYLPLYAEFSEYQNLCKTSFVEGNPDGLSDKELHERSWAVMEPILMKKEQDGLETFLAAFATLGDKTSDDLKEIVPAAVFSRVDTLVVPVGVHQWGFYDPDSNTVVLHDEQQPGDDDLLDVAAVHTLLNGGRVHALAPDRMPVRQHLAATFRFPGQLEADVQKPPRKMQR